MKKRKTTIIMVLFFFMGLLILLYPAISDFYNQKVQSKSIVDYEALLEKIDDNNYDEIFNKADLYNQKLRNLSNQFINYKSLKNYKKILNIDNKGMMGYISIDKIKVELPIYHGTSEEVLNKAVGHIEGSSLPVGGIGTHSVLSAHRGLPSSMLFTNLDKLEIGDTFTITTLNRTLTYEVDKITIVSPKEVNSLKIDKNADYVTLVTCTPYGINTHRLLVRGKRIENAKKKKFVTTEAFKISTMIVTPIVSIPIIFTLLLVIMFKPVQNKNRIKQKYIYPSKIKNEVGGNKNGNKKI